MTDLQELAERLLTYNHPGTWEGGSYALQLLPGAVPDDLPFILPLPANARVIGSSTSREDATLVDATVLLDAPDTASGLLTFYEREFAAQGWHPPVDDPFGMRGGFVAARPISVFCRGADGPALTLNLSPLPSARTEVRVTVHLREAGLCAGRGHPRMLVEQLVPQLTLPDDARQRPAGFHASSSDRDYHSALRVETRRDATDLEAHVAQQLAAAGWHRVEGQGSAAGAWSGWRVPGDVEAEGRVVVLTTVQPDVYHIDLQVDLRRQ